MPRALLDLLPRLNPSAVKLYLMLLGLAQKHSAVQLEVPAYETRDLTGLDDKSTTKARNELDQLGLIHWRKGAHGVMTYLLLNPVSGMPLPPPEGRRGVRQHRPTLGRSARTARAARHLDVAAKRITEEQDYPLSWDEIGAEAPSPKTVRNLLGLLQSVFSLAVDNDLISRSPVRDKHKPRVTRSEKPVWTPEQLKLIIQSVPDMHRNLFQTAMLTGARLGELLGLQWRHVDLESQKLEIKQALWEGEIVQPKTEGSVRVLYFGPALFNALAAQRQSSAHTGPEDFVFCKRDGSGLNPDLLRRNVLYPTLDRIGIARSARSAGFHTFRHSAATIINQKTGNLKLVQKLLGHSNLSTTADVYTQTSAEADRSAALALEQAVYGDLFQVVPSFWNRNKSGTLN